MVRPDRDEHPRATTAGIHGTPGGNFPEKERARVEVGHWQCSRSFSILRTDEAPGRPIGAMGAFLAGYPGGVHAPCLSSASRAGSSSWGGKRESNPQPSEPQSGALPVELFPPPQVIIATKELRKYPSIRRSTGSKSGLNAQR